MDSNRVKYYSNDDMSIGFYLDRLKTVVDSVSPAKQSIDDINDALELVNIIQFIDNELFSTKWTKKFINELKSKNASLKSLVGKYFSKLSNDEIGAAIKLLNRDYYGNFIDCFSRYKLGDKVSADEFKELLMESGIPIWEILESEYLVEKFPDVIKESFLSDPKNFEIFLSDYTYSHNKRNLHIPNNISKDEMLALCIRYVESEDANPNYLEIIQSPIKGTEKYIFIDAKTKLKIKKRAEKIHEKLFGDLANGGGLKISIAILSSKEAYDKEIAKSTPTDMITYVDSDWLKKYHDYPTILNNFLHVYEFFSDDLISTMPSLPNQEMGVLERHMGVKTENSYEIGQFFGLKHQLAVGKVRMVAELLSRHNIRIEDVIDWYFSSYSKEEYGVEWLPLNMPSKNEHTGNKTATLFRIEESIRTQYEVLQSNGEIDSDMVNMTNTPDLGSLKSFVEHKYAYLNDDNISNSIMALLYSDQSSIVYIDETRKGHNFIALISNHALKISDFHDHQKPRVQYLIDHGVINIKDDSTLGYVDIHELYVYKKLFTEGVLGYYHSSQAVQKALDAMKEKDRIVFHSSLYSTQEANYLNFVLNNKIYDNSWAIRNMYQHGLPAYKSDDLYLFDYYLALLVLMHHVIKINDELTLRKILNGEDSAYIELG